MGPIVLWRWRQFCDSGSYQQTQHLQVLTVRGVPQTNMFQQSNFSKNKFPKIKISKFQVFEPPKFQVFENQKH